MLPFLLFICLFLVFFSFLVFGILGDASQLTSATKTSPPPQPCHLSDILTLGEPGKITEVLKADGAVASARGLKVDAAWWAANFAQDVFNNHCTNHEHD
jgi:hypothetical protein